MRTIGKILKRAREQAELTQEQAAAATGYNLGVLRQWEQDIHIPMADKFIDLMEFYRGLGANSIDWFVRENK